MRTIIAGGRNITDYSLLKKVIGLADFKITEIISGGAKGVDMLGEAYATSAAIDLVIFPANWMKYDEAAGPIRNERMADYASSEDGKPGALIAIWDGQSHGTGGMIKLARKYKLKIYVWRIDLGSGSFID